VIDSGGGSPAPNLTHLSDLNWSSLEHIKTSLISS